VDLESIALAAGLAWASGLRLYVVIFLVGIAGVDDPRRDFHPLVDDLDRRDLPRAPAIFVVLQRHDGVLDGDEVAAAEIAGGAVVGLAQGCLRIGLDEA